MAFDLSTAAPADYEGGFDLSSAQPIPDSGLIKDYSPEFSYQENSPEALQARAGEVIPKADTYREVLRDVIKDTPWWERQRGAFGAAMANKYEGLKGLTPLGTDYNNVANQQVFGEEAPLGYYGGHATTDLAIGRLLPPVNNLRDAAALAGLIGLTTTPGGASDRGKAGALMAAGPAVMSTARALGKIGAQALKRSPTASERLLAAEGVESPPPWALASEDISATNAAGWRLFRKPFEFLINPLENKSIESLNRAVINRAKLSPDVMDRALGQPAGTAPEQVTNIGRAGMKQLADNFKQAYNGLYKRMSFDPADNQLLQDWSDILSKYKAELPPKELNLLKKAYDREVYGRWSRGVDSYAPTGDLLGEEGGKMMTDLRTRAASYLNNPSSDEYQKTLGHALSDLNDSIEDALMRQNPTEAQTLGEIRSAYANYKVAENASLRADKTAGVFAPGQLSKAAQHMAPSIRMKVQGAGKMQDLADAANKYVPAQYHNPVAERPGRIAEVMLSAGRGIKGAGAAIVNRPLVRFIGQESARNRYLRELAGITEGDQDNASNQ